MATRNPAKHGSTSLYLFSHGGRADPDLPEETRRGGGAGISGAGLAECSRCLQLQIENGEYQTVSIKERYLATP
jgi:hypothetical protein